MEEWRSPKTRASNWGQQLKIKRWLTIENETRASPLECWCASYFLTYTLFHKLVIWPASEGKTRADCFWEGFVPVHEWIEYK
jgi:hypothetical protein